MKKALAILTLGILACIALFWAWRLSEPAAPKAIAKKETAKPVASKKASPKQELVTRPTPEQTSPPDSETAQSLLDAFYLTGNKQALQRAQELYPTDPNVILVSCLEARTSASPFLTALEKLDPNNALPHLIRAGLYAEQGNLKRLASELEKALSKDHLSLKGQERLNRLLDQMLAQPMAAELSNVFNQFDHNYGKLMYLMHKSLVANPSLFGDEVTTISKGLQVVEKWRLSNDMEHFPIVADHMELDLLRIAQRIVNHGPEGQAVAARLETVQAELSRKWESMSLISKRIWKKPADLNQVQAFLLHVRQQGVPATLNWITTLPAPGQNSGNYKP